MTDTAPLLKELLATLQMALSAILTAEKLDGLDPEMFEETKAKLRTAIAKAEGRE